MKNTGKIILRLINTCVISAMVNIYVLFHMVNHWWLWLIVAGLFLFINVKPTFGNRKIQAFRLRLCANGCELLYLFLASMGVTVAFHLAGIFIESLPFSQMNGIKDWILHILIVAGLESFVFWNGIIRVYAASVQLGIKWRVIGIACGWIPIVHLWALGKIIHIVSAEVTVENEKMLLNQSRKEEKICATKYPILMVHGVFFRDSRYLNYWGRIPQELEKNGAVIYYGNHQSAASVEDSGKELLERIKEIIDKTGCEKVNIIAHSKGGLDCRYAISALKGAPYIASLTTINTPHRGCEFADYLLSKVPEKQKEAIARTYNAALRKLGDFNPDFLAAVNDLTAEACRKRNEFLPDVEGVYYQSTGSRLNVASGGRFPLNLTHKLVKYFDGANDGLVGEKSFAWGQYQGCLTVNGKRGISHGDMIDLNRENLPEFDVREFYVQLVHKLKEQGM